MSIVANLPEDLSQFLLKDWLNVKEWTVLDNAACNSLLRPQFLRSVVQLRWELPPLTEIERYSVRKLERFYRWVYKRGIRLIELDLNDELFLGGMIPDFIRYEYVLSVKSTVAFSEGRTINMILESCINLRSLTCRVGSIDFVSLKVSVLRGLKSLEMIDSRLFDDKSDESTRVKRKRILSLIHEHCHQLHTLQCPVVYETGKEPLIVGILHYNPGIHTLTIAANTAIIQCITEYKIVNLSSLNIVCSEGCYSIATIMVAYPTLQEFDFRTIDYSLHFAYFKDRCHLEMNIGINLEGWDNLLSVFPRITSLTLHLGVMLSDDRIQAFFAVVGSSLTALNMCSIYCLLNFHIETSSLVDTLAMCPHLESLTIVSFDPIHWVSIFADQNSFRHVCLAGGMGAPDVLQLLSQLRSLESFNCTSFARTEERQLVDETCNEYRNVQNTPTVFTLQSTTN